MSFFKYTIFIFTVIFLGELILSPVHGKPAADVSTPHGDNVLYYTAPKQHNAQKIAALPTDGVPHNIILIVGNGMGQGAIQYTALHTLQKNRGLLMESLPVSALVSTLTADGEATDSAAAGTALACAYKTGRGMVGMTPGNQRIGNIAEAIQASGRSVGIITTNSLTGPTTAAFSAHVTSRSMAEKIAVHQLHSNYDLLIGENIRPFTPIEHGGSRLDSRNICREFEDKGYFQIRTVQEMAIAPDGKLFGILGNWDKSETLLGE